MDYEEGTEIMGLTGPDKMLMEQQQQQAMVPDEQNPFNDPRYANIQTPDTPMNYGGGMAEVLLNDNEVPEFLRKKFWWIFNKDNILTFLDVERKQQKMVSFDVAIIDNMNSMDSYDEYDFSTEAQLNIKRNSLDVKLDRAVGIKGGNTKNERIILQSQFTESRAINEVDTGGAIKEGFFKRLMGRRG